ncbi:uncharacterized protein PFL1_05262 [Pseudozyma flocculosa PF-1]|uniref:Related to cullin 4A n=2 Tax=Pseudozyma flocculosa TaxID=84751 RepID=A0A5C3F7M9_9BASI|nr:uncharacterized protein PFL1_05262 [Pseudozyma flocculosa PF-1]EPQ27340.1 hypothetical protein PFL1_05262 [Pseudozyma flocculosa PF-1]SPO39717.1 related to cullin 4A [Pseudozyma flocculosa]
MFGLHSQQHRGDTGPLAAALAPSRTANIHSIDAPPTSSHGAAVPALGFGAFLRHATHVKAASGTVLRATPRALDPASTARLPDRHASSSAIELVRAVRHLLALSSTPADRAALPSLESLYAITELQLTANAAGIDDLYDRIKIEMERAAGELARYLAASGTTDETPDSALSWLATLSDAWTGWLDRVSLVQSVLLPLDRELAASASTSSSSRGHASSQSQTSRIWDLAIDTFALQVLENDSLSRRALACIALGLDADRAGTAPYHKLHAALVQMYTRLGAYPQLEKAVCQATERFYRDESAARMAQQAASVGGYLAYADTRVREETERGAWLLSDDAGRKRNLDVALSALVAAHLERLIAGLPELIEARRLDDLGRLFALLRSVDALPSLRTAFADHIKAAGGLIVNDRERDDEMIERLLEFKAAIDRIVADGFGREPSFVHAQRDSFEVFVNRRENKPAELIAKFLDVKLRSGNKTMTDDELERCLDEALVLFRYTHDKDMFEEFYKRHFAKRLLLNRSASSDAEKSMLLKLKEECGPGFTAKLETMIKDVELSRDLMQEYAQARAKAAKESGGAESDAFDLSVSVLTQAHWPTYPQVDVILPADMAATTDHFVRFYQNRNSGRRLHWQHSLGTLSLVATFPKAGTKELNVSTFQAIVLLLFNGGAAGEAGGGGSSSSSSKLSYRDIRAQTGLEDKELKRTLQSLACGQIPTRVLRKVPQGKDVDDDDEFEFNERFKNERHRIRINQIQLKETAEEQKSTEQRVFLDRELILQAAAVRVLKARKTIKHSELITEVVDQIKSRFAIDVSEIKKTFEILIDKEYMERVEGERGMYRYLA